MNCPFCNNADLVDNLVIEHFRASNGVEFDVLDYEISCCPGCAEELITPEQGKRNKPKVADARRQAEGLLTSEKIKSIRTSAGLSQRQASLVLGAGPNSFHKYESGEVVQSKPADRLFRVFGDVPEARDYLLGLAGEFQIGEAEPSATTFRALPIVGEMTTAPWHEPNVVLTGGSGGAETADPNTVWADEPEGLRAYA